MSKTGLRRKQFFTDISKAVTLFQFLARSSVVSYMAFILSLFVLHFFFSPCFGASGRLYFVIVALPGYIYYFCMLRAKFCMVVTLLASCPFPFLFKVKGNTVNPLYTETRCNDKFTFRKHAYSKFIENFITKKK